MEQMTKRTIIWVERLCFLDAVYLFLQSLFADTGIRYDENKTGNASRRLLGLLRPLGLSNKFIPAGLSLEKRDSLGCSINYQMEANLEAVLDGLCKKYFSKEPEKFCRMIKSYLSVDLFGRCTFITMVEYSSEFISGQSKSIFYLTRSPFNEAIRDFYKKKGYSIRESLINFSTIKYYLRPFYLVAKLLLMKCGFKRTRSNISAVRPSVWIEYCRDLFFDFAFWKESVNANDFDIVYYLDRDDDLNITKVTNNLENRGLKWVYLHFSSLVAAADLSLGKILGLIKDSIFSFFRLPGWRWVFFFERKMRFCLFKEVFKKFKVKLLIQHQELAWMQQVQVEALEAAGGIMVGFHWSNFPFSLEPFHLTPEHVYFVWGKANREWAQRKGNTCQYILPSGVWISNNKKQEHLESFSKNFEFTIAIFDSSVSYNIFLSADSMAQFYLTVLKLIEDNPRWGGIIKSKNWNLNELAYLYRGKEVVKKITELVESKKLVFLDRYTSPLIASAHARLSACFSLNSAGILAGIHGHRAIHWDCSGWMHNWLYKEKDQKIIYPELDGFREAIIKASKGDNEIGNFSRWRDKFNYFDDFRASKRVGSFIQNYMDGILKESGSSNNLLDRAVKTYIEENGIREDFFKTADSYLL